MYKSPADYCNVVYAQSVPSVPSPRLRNGPLRASQLSRFELRPVPASSVAGRKNANFFPGFTDELKDYLFGAHAINKIVTLGSMEFPVSWENEIKLWTFLETRAALLLKAYKTTSEVTVSRAHAPVEAPTFAGQALTVLL